MGEQKLDGASGLPENVQRASVSRALVPGVDVDPQYVVLLANNLLSEFRKKVLVAQAKEPEVEVRGDIIYGYSPITDVTGRVDSHYKGEVPVNTMIRFGSESLVARNLALTELGVSVETKCFGSPGAEPPYFFSTDNLHVFLGIEPEVGESSPVSMIDAGYQPKKLLCERLYYFPDPSVLRSKEAPFDPYRYPMNLRP